MAWLRPLAHNPLLHAPVTVGAVATLVAPAPLHLKSPHDGEMAAGGRLVHSVRRAAAWVAVASRQEVIQVAPGASYYLFDDVTHSDGATLSRRGLSFGHQELVAMELTVLVAVVAIVRSNRARLIQDSSVLSSQLSLIPFIPTWSNNDYHLLTGGRLFGLGHPHRFKREVSERVGVRIRLVIRQVRKENALVVVRNKPTLLHVHSVDGVQLAADPLV